MAGTASLAFRRAAWRSQQPRGQGSALSPCSHPRCAAIFGPPCHIRGTIFEPIFRSPRSAFHAILSPNFSPRSCFRARLAGLKMGPFFGPKNRFSACHFLSPFSEHACLSVCRSVCLSVCLSVSVCLSACLSVCPQVPWAFFVAEFHEGTLEELLDDADAPAPCGLGQPSVHNDVVFLILRCRLFLSKRRRNPNVSDCLSVSE